MSTLHFQKVRFCMQCKEALPTKCDRCVKHPDRKPRVIELYDFPEPIKAAECGCCFLFKCQVTPCQNAVWRCATRNYKNRKTKAKNFCCGKACAVRLANTVLSSTSVSVACAYCGRPKMVQAAVIKTRRHVFCDPSHHYMWVRKTRHEAKQLAIAAIQNDEESAQLWCGRCRDIVPAKLKNLVGHIYLCEKGHTLNVGGIEKEYEIRGIKSIAVLNA